jgi:hypothetical protein
MKSSRTCLSIASVGLSLAGSQPQAHSATMIRSLTLEVVGTGAGAATGVLDVLFDPVDDVSQIVSISAGSVATHEGGSMVISAILSNDSLVQLFSTTSTGFFSTNSLASITGNTFTAFVSPVTVKGLRFSTVKNQTTAPVVTLPSGASFTFAVPETSTALLSIFGLGLVAMRRSRK